MPFSILVFLPKMPGTSFSRWHELRLRTDWQKKPRSTLPTPAEAIAESWSDLAVRLQKENLPENGTSRRDRKYIQKKRENYGSQ